MIWAGNQKYTGTIASFDHVSGQHRIDYEDGDVVYHDLTSRRVEWRLTRAGYVEIVRRKAQWRAQERRAQGEAAEQVPCC